MVRLLDGLQFEHQLVIVHRDLKPENAMIVDGNVKIMDTRGSRYSGRRHRGMFADIGFQVMCAVGTSGLTFALRSETPALIVTELQARDLTLTSLFVRLRSDASTRCIPVVVVTSCCDNTVLGFAKTSGAAAVLPKLVDFDCLRAWVDALCPR